LQWERWSGCDDEGAADQRENREDAAEAEALRGGKAR